ncbi:MAG: hypothetical protein KGN79_02075 [Acidobacteriota bacterium]|nr:hypothetical protein [Acidobacteriota bacterium]
MADLSALNSAGTEPAGGGLLGARTRAQCASLLRMRWQMQSHAFRTTQGAMEFGARLVSYLVYGAMGLGLGVGAGAVAYQLAAGNMWQFLPIEFWVVFFIWQMIPVALAAFQEQFDLSFVLRFPVSFSAFYALYLVFSLSDISTIVGGLCSLGILTGIAIVRPDLALWVVAALVAFGLFNLLLVRLILAWVDRWLAQRRTREIASVVFLLLLLSLQLFNPALYEHGRGGPRRMYWVMHHVQPYAETLITAQQWLPPGLAARAIGTAAKDQPVKALESLSVFGLYLLAVGGLLGVRIRADYRGEELSEAPSRKEKTVEKQGWLLNGSGPIAAVLEKELRTILRSMPLLYAIGAPLFMVLIFGSMLRNGGSTPSGHIFVLALPMCVGYALLGSSQLVYNNLGTEGYGIQLLFLSPTPVRRVMLAKNLFHGVLFLLVAVFAGVLAILRLGWPDGTMLLATAAWILFALPANLAVGNVLSIIMPHRTNLSRLKKQRVSASSALLSLFVQLILLGVGGTVFGIAIYLHKMWIAVPVFTVLAFGAIVVWMRILHNSDAMANSRRDKLISVLARAE